jgi:hypothetical protein
LPSKKRKSVSVSSLRTFLHCPAQYFFQYYSGAPKKTDYPRLCGVKVHSFIKLLEKGHKKSPRSLWRSSRRFYYSDLEAAKRSWRNQWAIAVEQETKRGRLTNPNPRDTFSFAALGERCIENYWKNLSGLTIPLEVEQSYSFPWPDSNLDLNGNIDQIRPANLDYARAKRPELFKGGELHPDFAPVIILDLKTGWDSYSNSEVSGEVSLEQVVRDLFEKYPDNQAIASVWLHYQITKQWPREWRKLLPKKPLTKETSLEEKMRLQFNMHNDLQATAYCWLYHQKTGKWPVGFWFYFLRSDSAYFTSRDGFPEENELGKKALKELDVAIQHLVGCENSESYPKNVGSGCRTCDYTEICLGKNQFSISPSEKISGPALDRESLEIKVARPVARTKRMKLKVERRKQLNPIQVVNPKPVVRIQRDLPWREEDW